MPTPSDVLDALRRIHDPDRDADIVSLGYVKGLTVEDGRVAFTVVTPRPDTAFARQAEEACRRVVREQLGRELTVDVTVDSPAIGLGADVTAGGKPVQTKSIPGVRHTVAVASGKGGVGKSTVAVNLAVALARQGHAVGLVDTDIYGPSIPTMFGIGEGEKPRVDDDRKIVPLEREGVKLLSMGFLVDQTKAVIWRGPMVSSAVRQFLGDARWGELDYLVLDLPPGTGDIQLTIVQTIGLTGAVIVSTPQEVALADARKGIAMFDNVHVPVLGIVENMAYFAPPDLPDRKYYLFGEGGARRLAEARGLPLLGQIPIEQDVREGGDAGTPVVVREPTSAAAQAFERIARETVRAVELRVAEQPPTLATEILYR